MLENTSEIFSRKAVWCTPESDSYPWVQAVGQAQHGALPSGELSGLHPVCRPGRSLGHALCFSLPKPPFKPGSSPSQGREGASRDPQILSKLLLGDRSRGKSSCLAWSQLLHILLQICIPTKNHGTTVFISLTFLSWKTALLYYWIA